MKKLFLVGIIALSAQSSFAWSGTFYNVIENNSSDLTFATKLTGPGMSWENYGWSGWDDIYNSKGFAPDAILYQASGHNSYVKEGPTLSLDFNYASEAKFNIHNYVNYGGANIHILCKAYTPTENDKAIWWFGYKNGNELSEHFSDMQVNISVKNSYTPGYYDLYYSFSRPTNKGTVNIFESANAISVSGNSLPYTGILRKCFTK